MIGATPGCPDVRPCGRGRGRVRGLPVFPGCQADGCPCGPQHARMPGGRAFGRAARAPEYPATLPYGNTGCRASPFIARAPPVMGMWGGTLPSLHLPDARGVNPKLCNVTQLVDLVGAESIYLISQHVIQACEG